MIPRRLIINYREPGFPRVSGDDPEVGTPHRRLRTFSPRERG